MAPRYVHEAFGGGEGLTFSALVRSRQLSRVYRLQSDPRQTDRSISSVDLLGPGDFSYFHRALRRR